jgi:hypothetical protein
VKLQHVKVGHKNEVVCGSLLKRLYHKVVHDCHVVKDKSDCLVEKSQSGV